MTLDDRLSTASSSSPPPSSSRHSSSSAASQISGDEEVEEYAVKVDVLTLYVRAACDNLKYGACPFCQRIFMLLMLKVSQGANLRFRVATVPSSRLPDEFKPHGLRNLPAIIHGRHVAIDTVEEISEYVESAFSTSTQFLNDNQTVRNILTDSRPRSIAVSRYNEDVDRLARNFFSKFCFYIKSVSRDSTSLIADLRRLDDHLQQQAAGCKYIFGNELSKLDCEVLPKLHHLRVAAFHLKGFEIPLEYTGIWRYLNNAYNEDIFLRTCPPDQEIVLHWASRPDTPSLSYEEFSSLTRYTAKFSFDVPALAIPIVLN